jgi:tRNA(Arg) A34 adenosine deaminase TadA|mmetsp:Transcript_21188/g.34133  ORF Transcript_21188/g.34133 Transcript_21188/m.34133 type:complete len:436 (-) Transcript_21188:435-1742(-)|eukprot:CAMPEP_0169098116 /NCGR_PEP_ID=MMETSP1015-20121227/19867_1 /TAXON_ID=342587 /ORGANISM="Karlodinium micrum, Strain CCMP2283" /LENGTH=435 /DNA_ID=CAMNT_0009158939 /DNA_START=64 /DNA_END=1371 /DNA_ORIENTATION=+
MSSLDSKKRSAGEHIEAPPQKAAATEICGLCSEGDDPIVAEAFMSCAAQSAKAGVKLQHGGPFGACVVKGGIVISCAHNSVLLDKDPTCHAEMNAVRQACMALQSHDLSDCELYTSCEPCPMCWGAVQWSRLSKVYIGADRFTAAKYGFDDKVFYDEVEHHAETFGLHRYGFVPDTKAPSCLESLHSNREHKNMMEVHVGILKDDVEQLFSNKQVNKTYRRKCSGTSLKTMYEEAFKKRPVQQLSGPPPQDASEDLLAGPPVPLPTFPEDKIPIERHEAFMKRAIEAAKQSARAGLSKEREPFGAVMVRNGEVVAKGTNTVLHSRDATATAEVNAIRAAAQLLGKYDLSDCVLYTTAVPDVMSMCACLWARVPQVYAGVTQEHVLKFGHEEGWLHFQELMTGRPEDRTIPTVNDVAKPLCEDVFKFWASLNGKIY